MKYLSTPLEKFYQTSTIIMSSLDYNAAKLNALNGPNWRVSQTSASSMYTSMYLSAMCATSSTSNNASSGSSYRTQSRSNVRNLPSEWSSVGIF